MKVFHNFHPEDIKSYDTERLRKEFFEPNLFIEGKIQLIYSHIDRIVAIGACPTEEALRLDDVIDNKSFGTDYFLQRRELGIINLGGKAEVRTKDNVYILDYLDGLYLGKETEDIVFTSLDNQPAYLYCLSAPAHHKYPNKLITQQLAKKVALGEKENANERVINQYLHPDIVDTCQLCMGVTHLANGSVWNTMPPHTHLRRMEVYLYFNIQPQQVVFHFLGEPEQTRHIIMRDKQLVFSPSWSIHSGCGTQNYSFVWGMIGENQTFDDMDFVDMHKIS